MRAAIYRSFGPAASVLKIETVPLPVCEAGQVLVKVASSGVNPLDYKLRQGIKPAFLTKFPRVPGGDFAGIVAQADANSKFKAGDKVFAMCDAMNSGSAAEYVVAPDSNLVKIPPNVSFDEAAGIPIAGMTAWQALEKSMPLKGKQVLIHAGAGGVGSFAIQIAKAQGAIVTTTCSARNVDFVTKTLGADHAVDYKAVAFEKDAAQRGIKYDHVVDVMGGDYEVRSFKCLKRSGNYANVANNGWMDRYKFKALGASAMLYHIVAGKTSALLGGPGYNFIFCQPQATRGLNQIAELLVTGQVKVVIDQVLPLDKIAEAHEYVEKAHTRGKVIIKVADL